MKSNMMYGLLVLFLLFLITANPSGTGENGRDFVGWLSSGWDDAREFVGSLAGDEESDPPETNELGEVIIPTVAPAAEPTAPPTQQVPAETVSPGVVE